MYENYFDMLAGDIACDINQKVRILCADGGELYANDPTGTLRDKMANDFTEKGIIFEKIYLHTLFIKSMPKDL